MQCQTSLVIATGLFAYHEASNILENREKISKQVINKRIIIVSVQKYKHNSSFINHKFSLRDSSSQRAHQRLHEDGLHFIFESA